jgi:hypothetical protein
MRGLVNESDRTAVITGDMQNDVQLYRDLSESWEHDDEVQVTIDGNMYTGRVSGMNMISHMDDNHTGWDAQLFDIHKAGDARQ